MEVCAPLASAAAGSRAADEGVPFDDGATAAEEENVVPVEEDDWEIHSNASIGSTDSHRSHLSATTVDEASLFSVRFIDFRFVFLE